MKFLYNIFKKKENPFYTIFKQVIPKEIDLGNSRVYHIKSFEFTDSNMKMFYENMDKNDFYNILDKLEYNSQSNNVALYYIVNPNGKNDIYLVSDPFELYEKEYIINHFNGILDEQVMKLTTVVQINL